MTDCILPTEIIFNKSPYQSPFPTKPVDARRPIQPCQKQSKRSWYRRFNEAKSLAIIGAAFAGAVVGNLLISTLLPGGFA